MRSNLKKTLTILCVAAFAVTVMVPAINSRARDKSAENLAEIKPSQFMDCFKPMPMVEPFISRLLGGV